MLKDTLSPTAAADQLGVHPDTLKRWAKAGHLPSIKTPGGWLRFRQRDIDAFRDEYAVLAVEPLPEAAGQ